MPDHGHHVSPWATMFIPAVTPSQIALKQKNELNLFGRISKELYKSDSRDKSNDIYILKHKT